MVYERVKGIKAVEADVVADYVEAVDVHSVPELPWKPRLRTNVGS